MKQNVSLAVLLACWLSVAGCAGGGPTLEGKTPEQGGREEPAETSAPEPGDPGSSNGEQEPVASGVAAACAAGGAPVDLVALGTVERVRTGPDHSLAEIRVERVIEGNAGDTVLVRTMSGLEGSGYVPRFKEGGRYRLRLQREGGGQGDVFTTNLCLGTERLE